ncbi:MAG: PadR family transcriptional regulator [Dorea sp.]
MAIDTSLFSGSMTMLVLKLLEEKDMYGYEMIDTLAQRSNNVFELRAGTLYPLLRNLVNQKCLSSYEQEVNGKLRKYYTLTSIGRKVLEEKQKTWHEYSTAILSIIGEAV